MNPIVFLDTETTGLNPDLHDVWEIAAITHPTEADEASGEHHWIVRPDLTHADPKALEIGRFYERFPGRSQHVSAADDAAAQIARHLSGAVVIGSNPAFDERFLTRWLRRHGQCWTAHYRTIDVITLGAGYLTGRTVESGDSTRFHPEHPLSSTDISRTLGVDPSSYDRHTALGDAWWVHDLYMTIAASEGVA